MLLSVWNGNRPISVRPTLSRPELGNLAIVARTRGGKGLLAKAQILSWSGSLIVNDIKGDLYEETAGFKSTMSDVFVFDTRGIGNRFDPLHERETEDELRAMADYLLAEPHEGHGLIFTKRAVKNADPAVQSGTDRGAPAALLRRPFYPSWYHGRRKAARGALDPGEPAAQPAAGVLQDLCREGVDALAHGGQA